MLKKDGEGNAIGPDTAKVGCPACSSDSPGSDTERCAICLNTRLVPGIASKCLDCTQKIDCGQCARPTIYVVDPGTANQIASRKRLLGLESPP